MLTSDYTLTFADEVVMTLFIKQRCEELFLFDQLSHQFLLLLTVWHFLLEERERKKTPRK